MKRILSLSLAVIMLCIAVFGSVPVMAQNDYRRGFDISQHNGDFNLAEQKDKGRDFVMLRLGYFTHLDKEFLSNVKKAVAEGMDFGVYLYSYAYSESEAQQEADFVLDTLHSLPEEYLEYMNLPVAYDLEEPVMLRNCTKAEITKQMTVFCDTIASAGFTPMVYANTDWFTNYIDIKLAHDKGYKLWYAYYPSSTPTSFDSPAKIGKTGYAADMWQYSTSKNTLDLNVMYPSMGCRTHTFEEVVLEPTCTENGCTKSVCSECGFSRGRDVQPPLGHSFTLTRQAEIGKNGSYTCTLCGEKQTINQPKTFELSATTYEYNGKVRKPSVTVTDSKGTVLKSGKDYSVTYQDGRKLVGKYKVTIKLRGDYSGTKNLYFYIKPKGTSIKSVSAKSKGFTVKWKKQASQTTGYELQYSTSSKFTKPTTVTVKKNSTTSRTIKQLKGKKKYFVRVRTYQLVGSKAYYSPWSKKVSVVTKK